jgi:hypothetical protein
VQLFTYFLSFPLGYTFPRGGELFVCLVHCCTLLVSIYTSKYLRNAAAGCGGAHLQSQYWETGVGVGMGEMRVGSQQNCVKKKNKSKQLMKQANKG